MKDTPVIPEFQMYADGLEENELKELKTRMSMESRTGKDRFMQFTDIISEIVGSGEWKNHSKRFVSICAKSSFLRGMYGYNQLLAKGADSVVCKGYAAAAYCRQSLDPRWLNNLRNYTNQAWQEKDYVAYAELTGQLSTILIDLGYTDRAQDVSDSSIEKVTVSTASSPEIRSHVQAALLRSRIVQAYIAASVVSKEEALIRLDSAEDSASLFDHQLALTDISYYRARILYDFREYDRSFGLLKSALRKYDRMGYLQGVANARNLRGVILINKGQFQDARDQFEELLIIQQQLNNQIGLANTLINVGEIDRSLGQLEQMETYNRRALEISQEAEYVKGISFASLNLGDVALRLGKLEEAVTHYEYAIKVASGAGHKSTLRLVYFLAGDAHFLREDFANASKMYLKAKDVCLETGFPLLGFTADISELVTSWNQSIDPEEELVISIRKQLGSEEIWLDSTDDSPMRDLRRRLSDNPSLEEAKCVLYDGEKNFECRADRSTLQKECFGNLFWFGSLCPYFKKFIKHLYSN